jgi:hypothetical protein
MESLTSLGADVVPHLSRPDRSSPTRALNKPPSCLSASPGNSSYAVSSRWSLGLTPYSRLKAVLSANAVE